MSISGFRGVMMLGGYEHKKMFTIFVMKIIVPQKLASAQR